MTGAPASSGTVAVGGGYTSVGVDAATTDAGVLSTNGAATVDGASTVSITVAIGGAMAFKEPKHRALGFRHFP